jgi:hypothetical protein
MAAFSPTDAALEGFRLAREKPRMVAVWAAVYLVVTAIMAFLLISFAGDALMALRAAEQTGEADPSVALAFFTKVAPISLLGLIVTTVFVAASYRVILRPEDSRYAYLRFGGDELRLMLLSLIFVGLWMGVTFAAVMAIGILAAVVGMAAGSGGAGVIALIGVLAGLAVLPVFVWLWVRLSMAWPETFADRKLHVFHSWRLTKGNFWRLLGAYVLAIILALIVMLLGLIIYAAVAAILTGGDLSAVGQVFEPDMSSTAAYFTPAMLIYTFFAGLLGPLQYLIMFAPGAVAYRQLTSDSAV